MCGMNRAENKNKKIERRKRRTRSKILGTVKKPRLSVFRSNRFTYVQLIDDENGKTLLSASTKSFSKKETSLKQLEQAKLLGKLLASGAVEKGFKEVVFDRGSYKYHGKIKSVAEGAREGGLKF